MATTLSRRDILRHFKEHLEQVYEHKDKEVIFGIDLRFDDTSHLKIDASSSLRFYGVKPKDGFGFTIWFTFDPHHNTQLDYLVRLSKSEYYRQFLQWGEGDVKTFLMECGDDVDKVYETTVWLLEEVLQPDPDAQLYLRFSFSSDFL